MTQDKAREIIEAVFARLDVRPVEQPPILAGARDRRSTVIRRTIAYTMRLSSNPPPTYGEIAEVAGYADPTVVRHAVKFAGDIVHAADSGNPIAIRQVHEMGLDLTGTARLPRDTPGNVHEPPGPKQSDELPATIAERFHNYDGAGSTLIEWRELDEDDKQMWRHLAQVARRIIAYEQAGLRPPPAKQPVRVSRTQPKNG